MPVTVLAHGLPITNVTSQLEARENISQLKLRLWLSRLNDVSCQRKWILKVAKNHIFNIPHQRIHGFSSKFSENQSDHKFRYIFMQLWIFFLQIYSVLQQLHWCALLTNVGFFSQICVFLFRLLLWKYNCDSILLFHLCCFDFSSMMIMFLNSDDWEGLLMRQWYPDGHK